MNSEGLSRASLILGRRTLVAFTCKQRFETPCRRKRGICESEPNSSTRPWRSGRIWSHRNDLQSTGRSRMKPRSDGSERAGPVLQFR
jgi:hypothetical protein